jgi:hypothetical protein
MRGVGLYYAGSWIILCGELGYIMRGVGLYYAGSWIIFMQGVGYILRGVGLYYVGSWVILHGSCLYNARTGLHYAGLVNELC